MKFAGQGLVARAYSTCQYLASWPWVNDEGSPRGLPLTMRD
jgi:hypothetical protein